MDIKEWSCAETAEYLKSHPEAKLVDVRTEEEYARARIKGAILVNSQEKAEPILNLPKDTTLIFQCHHGVRSYQAAIWFQKKGFTNVVNMAGGIDAWSEEVDPSVPRY